MCEFTIPQIITTFGMQAAIITAVLMAGIWLGMQERKEK